MIFENKNGKLEFIHEKEFKLEKEIQRLVESNLDSLLSLKFLKTEFSIEDYRFDSVAFDPENNAFVIIEYKKGRNESLVDQGLAYLNTLLTRKADFVLLYNEVMNSSRLIKDFDWSQTRLVFISPKFTSYQLKSVSFRDFANFSLYEIKQFSNGNILFNEIEVRHDISTNTAPAAETEPVRRELVAHTEEEHLEKAGEEAVELYKVLKERVLDRFDLKIVPKQEYIAFKAKTNVFDVTLRKNDLLIMVNLVEGEIEDERNFCRLMKKEDGTRIGHHGNGDYECKIKSEEEIDYFLLLASQSYKKNRE